MKKRDWAFVALCLTGAILTGVGSIKVVMDYNRFIFVPFYLVTLVERVDVLLSSRTCENPPTSASRGNRKAFARTEFFSV
jgi:hypothetical protein